MREIKDFTQVETSDEDGARIDLLDEDRFYTFFGSNLMEAKNNMYLLLPVMIGRIEK